MQRHIGEDMSIPQDIIAGAEAIDADAAALGNEMLMEAAPSGQFGKDVLNRLVSEVNKILPKIGMPLYPMFEQDITDFPPEFVDVILGIADIAGQAGLDQAITLENIEQDRDVAMLAGMIAELAEEQAFIDFIGQSLDQQMPEEVIEETEVVTPEGVEDEELFMQRM